MKTKIEQFVIDKVRELRLKENISQATLAGMLGVSKGFIGNVENPRMIEKYNLNHINEIAKIFNCPVTDFLPQQPFEDNKEILF